MREIGSRPAAALAGRRADPARTCARWMRTWASARTWTAPLPTPISHSRWASRPSPSAPAGREAAPIPPQEWYRPEGRDLGLKRILLTLLLLLRDDRCAGTASEPRNGAEAALVVNTVIWGATFVVVKEALAQISTLFPGAALLPGPVALLLLFREVAGVTASPVREGAGRRRRDRRFPLRGIFLQTLGLRFTTAPKSAFLTGLASVMVPLLAALVYRNQAPRRRSWPGLLVATSGWG